MYMRTIKFRIWKKDTKNWCSRPNMYINGWGEINYILGGEIESYCEPDNYVVMQFTGLLDKNGAEIYEGDQLAFTVFDYNDNDTQYSGYVVYTGSRFQIWNKPDDEFYGSDGGFDLDWVVSQDDEIEVIGNIFETK